MFPIELFGVKTNPAKFARNLGVIFDKNFTFCSHISAVCSSWLYHMRHLRLFAVTLIWIVQNYLQLLLCPLVSIIVIHFCTVSPTLTSLGFSFQKRLARPVTKSSPFTRSLPQLLSLHWLPGRFRILFKISLLTYKTLHEKQPVYLHSILAASLPSHSLRSNDENSLSIPKVKTNTGPRAFHSCAPSLWNNLPLSGRSAIPVATSKKNLKTLLFGLTFHPRYRHAVWPVDVMELFLRFCCWTPIRLSRHWAWHRRGYWRYRKLIDWLISYFLLLPFLAPFSWCCLFGEIWLPSNLSNSSTPHITNIEVC